MRTLTSFFSRGECCDPSLGLATKVKACKGVGQEECERVWRWRFTLPSEFPLWELESQWTPKPSESDCSGQNISHWGVFYIIGKLLKCRCLKWVRMTHSNICNTSYGKMKGRVWRTPKFLVRPTWGSKCVELRKIGTWGLHPTSSTKGGKRGVLEIPGFD